MPLLRFALILTLFVAPVWSQDMDQIIRRIQEVAPKESLALGIETELRAAYLLRESRPDLANAFLERGKGRLAAHPEIEPTKWMVSSLLSLDPERGEETILKPANAAVFNVLLQYYVSSNRADRIAAVLQKAARYEGARVGYVPTALQKMITLDPLAAADVYFTLRESPGIASRYPRLPVLFSEELPHAAAAHPEAVRPVLARLFPLFEDETFLANMPVSITTRIGGTEVRTKNAREIVLLRLGALARVAAPEEYVRNEKKFDSRISSVKTLDEVLLIADAQVERNRPQQAGFNFAKEPAESALAEWRKMTELRPRLYDAASALLARPDLRPAQKKNVMDEMIAAIQLAEKQEQAPLADDLIWYASKAGLDHATIRPAVEFLVAHVSEASYPLYDEAVTLIREYGVNMGQNNPSIEARIALAKLEEWLSDRYSFTLPTLDGKSVSLKDLRGKVVLLNFWATWCGPCRGEEPILEKVYRDLKDRGFMLLAITDEDSDVVRRFAEQSNMNLPVLIDRRRAVFNHYLVEGLPVTIILDRQGRLAARPTMLSDEQGLRKLLTSAGLVP